MRNYLLTSCIFALPLTANSALIDRGNGLIYDVDRDITWLANANLADNETFGVAGINANGDMSWDVANTWIVAMNNDSGTGYKGFNGWRLPKMLLPDNGCMTSDGTKTGSYGFYCTGSEMGHLFYDELMGEAGQSILTSGNPTELGKFINVKADGYWSGEEYDASNAWDFKFSNGNQVWNDKNNNPFFVWAVHDGDIGMVPVPAAVWLFGSGLIGLVGLARRNGNA